MIKFLDKIYLKDYTHRFSRILLIHINSFSLIFHKLFLPFVTHPQQLTKKCGTIPTCSTTITISSNNNTNFFEKIKSLTNKKNAL